MQRAPLALAFAPFLALALFLALPVACGADTGTPKVAAAELARQIEAGSAPYILDVRTPEEFAAGHLPGAVNIPHDQLAGRLAELPTDKSAEIVVHCKTGGRAKLAESALSEAGYTDVRDLEGHWQGWEAAGHPAETPAP